MPPLGRLRPITTGLLLFLGGTTAIGAPDKRSDVPGDRPVVAAQQAPPQQVRSASFPGPRTCKKTRLDPTILPLPHPPFPRSQSRCCRSDVARPVAELKEDRGASARGSCPMGLLMAPLDLFFFFWCVVGGVMCGIGGWVGLCWGLQVRRAVCQLAAPRPVAGGPGFHGLLPHLGTFCTLFWFD